MPVLLGGFAVLFGLALVFDIRGVAGRLVDRKAEQAGETDNLEDLRAAETFRLRQLGGFFIVLGITYGVVIFAAF